MEKIYLSEWFRRWCEIMWKACVGDKALSKHACLFMPFLLQKGQKGVHEDTWKYRSKKVKKWKQKEKSKGRGLQWGWNEAGLKHKLTTGSPGYPATWLPSHPPAVGGLNRDLGLPAASCTHVSSLWNPTEAITSPSLDLQYSLLQPDWAPHISLILAPGLCSYCSLSPLTCVPHHLPFLLTWIPPAQ